MSRFPCLRSGWCSVATSFYSGDYRIPQCPHCNSELFAVTSVGSNVRIPPPQDCMILCTFCVKWSAISRGKPRLATREELFDMYAGDTTAKEAEAAVLRSKGVVT